VKGFPVEPAMWAFGPNGVFPLFIRQGALNDKKVRGRKEKIFVDLPVIAFV
jgi:hypothetical protein